MAIKVDRWGPSVRITSSVYRRLTDPQITCGAHEGDAEHLGALGVSLCGITSVACRMEVLLISRPERQMTERCFRRRSVLVRAAIA